MVDEKIAAAQSTNVNARKRVAVRMTVLETLERKLSFDNPVLEKNPAFMKRTLINDAQNAVNSL